MAQLVGQRDFGPPHYYAHTNYVTIIFPSQSCLLGLVPLLLMNLLDFIYACMHKEEEGLENNKIFQLKMRDTGMI